MNLKSSKELVEEKKKKGGWDTYMDRPFIKHLVKEIQKVDPGIGAFLFPDTNIVVFFWHQIIVYKVILDEYNTTTVKIKEHVERVANTIRMLKLNMLPTKRFQMSNKGFNKMKTGKIL